MKKTCKSCLSKSDMERCQNFKSPCFGQIVANEKSCNFYERDGDKHE